MHTRNDGNKQHASENSGDRLYATWERSRLRYQYQACPAPLSMYSSPVCTFTAATKKSNKVSIFVLKSNKEKKRSLRRRRTNREISSQYSCRAWTCPRQRGPCPDESAVKKSYHRIPTISSLFVSPPLNPARSVPTDAEPDRIVHNPILRWRPTIEGSTIRSCAERIIQLVLFLCRKISPIWLNDNKIKQ